MSNGLWQRSQINGMRNVAWLAGFLRKKNGMYFIQQNNNEAQMIPVTVRDSFKMPQEFMPIEVTCSIGGGREGDTQSCVLNVIDVARPSVRSMPPMSTWVGGAAGEVSRTEFKPFLSKDKIKTELVAGVLENEEATAAEIALAELFRTSGDRLDSAVGRNANKAFLAGYIGATRFVEPNEHQGGGYVEIFLHQHKDPLRAIPVRLYSPNAKIIMKGVWKGCPAAFDGQIRMKVLPDDEGNIRSYNLHLRVSDVLVAVNGRDVKEVPDWWADLFRDGIIERNKSIAVPAPVVNSDPLADL